MESVTVSTKFQVVIPRKVREALRIKSGQKMQVIAYNNRVVHPGTPHPRGARFAQGNGHLG